MVFTGMMWRNTTDEVIKPATSPPAAEDPFVNENIAIKLWKSLFAELQRFSCNDEKNVKLCYVMLCGEVKAKCKYKKR